MPFHSFLNDEVDHLKPAPAKQRSSISLSDQWAGSVHSMTKLNTSQPEDNSLDNSRSALSSLSISSSSPSTSVNPNSYPLTHPRIASYAFAFDIDGVILNGAQTIPYARKAIKMLNGDNEYKIMVPYIFVTNGGGKPESVRAKDLSQRLGCEINEGQIIQGHTPMKGLASTYKNVLVVGGVGDTCRKIAEGYGFQNVYIPLDIMYWNPAVSPYYTLSDEEKKVSKKGLDFSQIEIEAILVFADSRNWAVDEQIILELLMSKDGRMGTVSKDYTEGPGIYFAHSDFIWSTDYKLSRYGMGALQVSIAALYRETTGKELKVTRFGKPQRGTFKYAEKVLSKWRIDVLEEYVDVLSESNGDDKKKGKKSLFTDMSDDDSGSDEDEEDDGLTLQSLAPPIPEASTVYFVGDTPDSDIRFANAHDGSWFSILVKTGVYKEGTVPKYKPKKICDNVLEAVKYGIDREAKKEMEEWRSIRTK